MATLVYLISLFLVAAWSQTRTIWQYQLGTYVANPCYGTCPSQDPQAQHDGFALSVIPPEGPAWTDCYPGDPYCKSASQINTVPQPSNVLPPGDCWQHLAFEYFQTFIDVPVNTMVTQFTVENPGNEVDDAVRITLFNSDNPDGIHLAYSYYQQPNLVDLSAYLVAGRNRLVITQEDSCYGGNTVFAIISLNGVPLDPTCVPPEQMPCSSSEWSTTVNDCVLTPITGIACNDGNACTTVDTCQAGVCVGSTPVVCSASDQCHTAGTCNPVTGVCDNPAAPAGQACDDGNACTQTDTCQLGACSGSNPVVCTALDQCHVAGTCDPSTGVCDNPEASTGTSCSDGNGCTLSDTCAGGVCLPGADKVCTALDQCHLAGVCEPSTGVCSDPAKCDGKKCDDGNACTQLDTCHAGVCVGKRPIVCTVGECQEDSECNPATGVCSSPDNKCDGSACDDGNACTLSDTCLDGECLGGSPKVCEASDQCHVAGECDAASGACSNPNKADGSPCDDGNACTQTDTCQAGVCVGGNPVVCTASDACHVAGVCEPSTGVCSNPNKADGASCDDGNACTRTDTCVAGVCTGGNPVVCKASDQCHDAGTCYPTTGKCSDPKKADGAVCDDKDKCTSSDTCRDGKCVGAGQVCCRTNGGRCGSCVSDCRGSHHSILDLFNQWNRHGRQSGPDDVDTGSSGCSGGKVCCVPRDQSTCRNDNNSCRIPEDD